MTDKLQHEIPQVREVRNKVIRQETRIQQLEQEVRGLRREMNALRREMSKRPADRQFYGGNWSPPAVD